MGYYKTIHGKKMDAKVIEIAEESVKGAGDGRISRQDAAKILAAVVDDNIYTEIERQTVHYIRNSFHWTDAAREWFVEHLAKWEDEFNKPVRMTPAELSRQHFSEEDVLATEPERLRRANDLQVASNETFQDHDDIGIIIRLPSGKRVEVLSNYIELAGQFVELRGGFDIPLRAIEKVEI